MENKAENSVFEQAFIGLFGEDVAPDSADAFVFGEMSRGLGFYEFAEWILGADNCTEGSDYTSVAKKEYGYTLIFGWREKTVWAEFRGVKEELMNKESIIKVTAEQKQSLPLCSQDQSTTSGLVVSGRHFTYPLFGCNRCPQLSVRWRQSAVVSPAGVFVEQHTTQLLTPYTAPVLSKVFKIDQNRVRDKEILLEWLVTAVTENELQWFKADGLARKDAALLTFVNDQTAFYAKRDGMNAELETLTLVFFDRQGNVEGTAMLIVDGQRRPVIHFFEPMKGLRVTVMAKDIRATGPTFPVLLVDNYAGE